MLRAAAWFIILVVALMSGALSLFRELMGIYAPNRVATPELFWTCTRIACIVSLVALWLRERGGRSSELKQYRAKLQDLTQRLTDAGPQVILGYEKNALHNGFFAKTNANVARLTVKDVPGTEYILKAEEISIIKANTAVPLQLHSIRKDGQGSAVLERFGDFVDAFDDICGTDSYEVTIPLELEYWDLKGNHFAARWLVTWNKIRWRMGLSTASVAPDPSSYRWTPPSVGTG